MKLHVIFLLLSVILIHLAECKRYLVETSGPGPDVGGGRLAKGVRGLSRGHRRHGRRPRVGRVREAQDAAAAPAADPAAAPAADPAAAPAADPAAAPAAE